jgi:hypothetical protein
MKHENVIYKGDASSSGRGEVSDDFRKPNMSANDLITFPWPTFFAIARASDSASPAKPRACVANLRATRQSNVSLA